MMKRKLKKKNVGHMKKKKWRKHLLKKKKRRKRENEFNVPERATLQSPGTTQRFFFFFIKEKTYIACVVERHTTETFFQSGNFEVSNLREKAARLHHARSAITFFFPSSFFFF